MLQADITPSGKAHSPSSGFSLIELSIVLIVVGIFMTAALSMVKVQLEDKSITQTRNNLQRAEDALLRFREMNGHYPCPARRDAPRGTAQFGKMMADCAPDPGSILATKDKGAPSVMGSNDRRVRIGLLPFRSLGISDADAMDSRGNILQYAVTEILTDPHQYNPARGAIDVVAEDGQSRIVPPASAHYVLFSTGTTGIGGYSGQGAATSACSKTHLDGKNCDDDAVFIDAPYSAGDSSFYDDSILYRQFDRKAPSKNGIMFLFKGQCPAEFRPVDGLGDTSGMAVLETRLGYERPAAAEDENNRLCFSPFYGVTYTKLLKNGETPSCPAEWTIIGYQKYVNSSEDEHGRVRYSGITYVVCAR